jgi:hypothetical protein
LAERVGRPFSHLKDEALPLAPQLTVDLWDEAETGVPCPVSAGDDANGWAFYYEDGLFTGSKDGRFMGYIQAESSAWLDRGGQRIVGCQASGHTMPIHHRSKPLSLLLSVWYNDHNVQVIHAGLVAYRGRGVLLAGPSGSGKTTATLTCMDAGFSYLGDDFVGVQQRDGTTFLGRSLFGSTRLEHHHLRRFSRLLPHALFDERDQGAKALVFVDQVFPAQLERCVPICAIAFPRVSETQHTSLHPIPKGQALLRLAYGSLRIPARGRAYGLDRLGELVAGVPTYWLELGRDLTQIPGRVAEWLDGVAAL